ncbi:hypothetical protein NM688_g8346 [Phlebia brevispora]|uniref:Uncharacterized protein n=1 Tax=Phlebia brevispora TaxID=194682 RepID=A0ACC1RUP1_9APHY|nr:hypothetical protein NM688_g8346 [Phlebia brevispora]
MSSNDIFYPDNPKRASRVEQLATQISDIQRHIQTAVEGTKPEVEQAVAALNRIVTSHAGYSSLDQYLDATIKDLPEAEKFLGMRTELSGCDPLFDLAFKASTGLLCLSLLQSPVKLALDIVNLCRTEMLQISTFAVVRGTLLMSTGFTEEGQKLVRAGAKGASGELPSGVPGGPKVVESNILIGIYVVIELIGLAQSLVQGSKQRSQLQDAIFKLNCYRFHFKKIEQQASAAQSSYRDVKTLLGEYEGYLNDLKNEEVTVEYVQKKMEERYKRVVDEITKTLVDPSKLSTEKIWGDLCAMDANLHAWTNEDPSLSQVLDWLRQHGKDSPS